ncbi:MAG: cell division protein FtsB [Pseudomonadales bacterium]|nr:cell division protein FtsB [Pseudomonadales bacterium]
MKWFWIILTFLFIGLQYRLWVGEGSLAEYWGLKSKIAVQQQQNQQLRERNEQLKAEVVDLKQGMEAIEERTRSELGMIKEGETFFQLVEKPTHPAAQTSD